MPRVHVFLCTYRRPRLLRRALDSLLGQSFTDWTCELHNDDPADPLPRQLAAEIGDQRIEVVDHPRNFGPTRTLNIPFSRPVDADYISLLEDDNWWEPAFLETMVAALDDEPALTVAWSDMRLWREESDGSWTDSGRTIWQGRARDDRVLFHWPQPDQWRSALHSHGAMLVRASAAPRYSVPDAFPVAAIEHVRERTFDYPLLLVNRPLANFAITRSTARSRSAIEWGRIQSDLAASFFAHAPLRPGKIQTVWEDARRSIPRGTNTLVTIGLRDRRLRGLLYQARAADWWCWLRSFLRRPWSTCRTLLGTSNKTLWEFLERHTAEQFRRLDQSRGCEQSADLPADSPSLAPVP